MANNTHPEKIAVLGGGTSALTAVYEITNKANWKEDYDITIYQLGWRLGGKGASGRNRKTANRIEEHGLHLWFGFYDNAFDMIQRVYKDNARPLTHPLATWEEAFKPYDFVVLEEHVGDKYFHWPLNFPRNADLPGKIAPPPTMWEYIEDVLKFVAKFAGEMFVTSRGNIAKHEHREGCLFPIIGLVERITGFNFGVPGDKEHETYFQGLEHWWEAVKEDVEVVGLDVGGRLIYTALKLVSSSHHHHGTLHHNDLLTLLERILKWLWEKIEHKIEENTIARRLWIMVDFFFANVSGMIADGVITEGFDVINHYDYRQWLEKNGATEITLNSAAVQGVYGLVFGGYRFFTFEAGTALRGAMRMFLTYRGSIYYRMQAGMGDTIYGPMYEVLKKRGVKFKFFHKVRNLKLSDDKSIIEQIEIGRQVTLADPSKEYGPLFDVKNLPCWPSTPLYEQIVESEREELIRDKINLESAWTPWKDREIITLQQGRDFDTVILGISIGALPFIAKELIDHSQPWKDMIKNVTAAQTQAFQLWFKPDRAGLGWPYWMNELPLSGTYQEPFDTWADMSDLIIRESWPDEHFPNNIAYVCGPVQQKTFKYDFSNHKYPEEEIEKVKKRVMNYMQHLSHHLWPNTSSDTDPSQFNWELLIDLNNGSGTERFDAQFFRINIDPSELYVLSETDSTKFRLKTDESGFDNLLITGDWIFNGFNAGCIEASVMSGKQTARALLGEPLDIPGEKDMV